MTEASLTKVVLMHEYEDSDEVEIETPWAEHLGGIRYQLKNIPFLAYGVSFDDIIEAEPNENEERPVLTRVVEKSGHRTLRVIFDLSIEESEDSRSVLETLARMNCGYAGNGARYFAVNVQPECDFEDVCKYLTDQGVSWEHADPTYEELYE